MAGTLGDLHFFQCYLHRLSFLSILQYFSGEDFHFFKRKFIFPIPIPEDFSWTGLKKWIIVTSIYFLAGPGMNPKTMLLVVWGWSKVVWKLNGFRSRFFSKINKNLFYFTGFYINLSLKETQVFLAVKGFHFFYISMLGSIRSSDIFLLKIIFFYCQTTFFADELPNGF